MAEKREVKQWITVNGKHIPIFEGESKEDAVKRATSKSGVTRKDVEELTKKKDEVSKKLGKDGIKTQPITEDEVKAQKDFWDKNRNKQIDKDNDEKEKQIKQNEKAAKTRERARDFIEGTYAAKRDIRDDEINSIKNKADRKEIQYLYKKGSGAWVHLEAMARAINKPLYGDKKSTEKSLRRNFDNMMKAWEDVRYVVESREAQEFLDAEMSKFRDRFEANMKAWKKWKSDS